MKNIDLNSAAPMRITIETVTNSPMVLCDCGGALFSEKMMFKKISAIMSPSGKEELFPMNVIVCDACGKVPHQFNTNNMVPEEMLATKKFTIN